MSILHSPSYGRASLACDLQEALRAEIDEWIWHLLSTRQIRIDHFKQSDDACLLTKPGRQIYYQALPELMTLWRKRLRAHSKFLVSIVDSIDVNISTNIMGNITHNIVEHTQPLHQA